MCAAESFPKTGPSPFWIGSILLLGFCLRLTGFDFGLPHLYHADEPIIVNHALAYGAGGLNPHFFKIPPLVSYLLFVVYGFYFVAGRFAGRFHDLRDFEYLFYSDPTSFYLVARLIFGVVLGTLSVYVFYRLIAKYFDHVRALIGAFLLAVCFLHVKDSHYVYADIPLVLIMIAVFSLFFHLLNEGGRLKTHLGSAVLIGLATATKYNGLALVLPYLYCAFAGTPKNKLIRYLPLTAAAGLSTFTLLNPYWILDFLAFSRELMTQSQSQGGVGWLHHLHYSLVIALGWPLLGASLAGALITLFTRNRDHKKVCFLIFVIGYYLVLCHWGQPYDRYVLPIVPFLIFFAADFVVTISEKIVKLRKAVVFVIILVLAAPTLAASILFDRVMLATDTRTLAEAWVEKNVPKDSRIALDWGFYMPPLRFGFWQLLEKRQTLGQSGHFSKAQERKLDYLLEHFPTDKPSYSLYFLSLNPEVSPEFLFAGPVLPYDLSSLKEKQIAYVIIANLREDREPVDFFKQLREQGKLVAAFSPYRDESRKRPYDGQPMTGGPSTFQELLHRERNGQRIEVYQIR